MHNAFRVLKHAIIMVRRNLQSYTMLSVTIILSFSILLGYLGLMDSEHYNRFKFIFAQDRGIVVVEDNILVQEKKDILLKKASEIGHTKSMELFSTSSLHMYFKDCSLHDGTKIDSFPYVLTICCPSDAWDVYCLGSVLPITWLDGQNRFSVCLEDNQILMDDQLFYALGLPTNNPTVRFTLLNPYTEEEYDRNRIEGEFTVVGTVKSPYPIEFDTVSDPGTAYFTGDYNPIIVFPTQTLNPGARLDLEWNRTFVMYSDSPDAITQLARSMNFDGVSANYESHNAATEILRVEKGTKSLIASILLLLLGINLYSSFTNALNNRKFEIGVKRALGASKWCIVRQFLYEGIIVMVLDIFLSIVFVVDLGIVYKVITEATPDQWGEYDTFVLHITPYSVAMFMVCAVSLTLVFSLIFAYKSTQVEIVEYLKAE